MSEATTTGAPDGGEEPKAKKKLVTVTPPCCPSSVATGYLILRGALMGLLGCNVEETDAALLQPTYTKEKIPSAKFATALGKKRGNGVLHLPRSSTSSVFHRSSFTGATPSDTDTASSGGLLVRFEDPLLKEVSCGTVFTEPSCCSTSDVNDSPPFVTWLSSPATSLCSWKLECG